MTRLVFGKFMPPSNRDERQPGAWFTSMFANLRVASARRNQSSSENRLTKCKVACVCEV
jgi:hypothetical protein